MSLRYQTEEDLADQGQQPPPVRQPIPLYTAGLIAALAAVFAVQMVTGLDNSVLAAGFVKPAFLENHEYWRILTGAALHGGPLHVFMNCYAFYSFGKIFEMISNRAHLAIVFLLSAIGGGLLSLISQPEGISVGASGGIVGLVSYLAVYTFKRRQFVSAEFRKSLLMNIGFILVFGLVLFRQIDNFGHIGGLIAGAVYGLIQIPTDEYIDPRTAGSIANALGLASFGIFLAVCGFSILLMLHVV